MKIVNPVVWFKEAEGTAEKLLRFSLILAGFATVLLFFGVCVGEFFPMLYSAGYGWGCAVYTCCCSVFAF